MTIEQRIAAAQARSAGQRDASGRPSHRRSDEHDDDMRWPRLARSFEVRAAPSGSPTVGGFASLTEHAYDMYDMYGPYVEVVALDAFDETLAADPLVEFTINHGAGGGLPMAHTRNGTLTLSAVKDGEETGLSYDAVVDASRHDVSDAVKAMARGDLAEASFKFRITRGVWSPDWTQYRIEAVDLHRGDVSAVNFGASPDASSGLRSAPPAVAPVAIADEDTARRVLITDADTRLRTA